jgi:hypothetical protein
MKNDALEQAKKETEQAKKEREKEVYEDAKVH